MLTGVRSLNGKNRTLSHNGGRGAQEKKAPRLNQDSLDFIEGHLVLSPVIKGGRPRAFVVRHRLGDLELSPVPQVLGDPRRPEGVAADARPYPGIAGATGDHAIDIRLAQGPVGELAGSAHRRPEQRSLGIFPEPRHRDVGIQPGIQVVMRRHVVSLPALFMKPYPGSFALDIHVLNAHEEHRSDPREGVDHERDERPIAQAHHGARVDAREKLPRLLGGKDGSLPLLHDMPRASDCVRWIGREHLVDHEPVEEHPQGGKLLLDRGRGEPCREFLNIGGDVDGPDLHERSDPVRGAPSPEAGDRLGIGFPGMGIAELGGEEFQDAFLGIARIAEQAGQARRALPRNEAR